MDNARSASRSRCVLKAEISFAGGAFRQDCIVRDLSETGARLVLKDDINLPAEFRITLTNRPEVSRAAVRWRSAGHVGIEFLGLATAVPPTKVAKLSQKKKLDEVLAENARLHKMIAELTETVATMKKSLKRFSAEAVARAS